MRSEKEMLELILGVAQRDERIRAALLTGSRVNPAAPKDVYQDYDVVFFVTDMAPYYNNPAWAEVCFGKPLIMQMPEAMRNPEGTGAFVYLMLFPDGNRVDLTVDGRPYVDNGEPAVALLDKDGGKGFLPPLPAHSDHCWHIRPPTPLDYYSCCNEFWWCLNNVAKGIARDELPYAMHMLNSVVRPQLHDMMNWYIGARHGYCLSTGKYGKYFKKFLPPEMYALYAATYSGGRYEDVWSAVDAMCGLFHTLALAVADRFGFTYRREEEDGMRAYLRMVRENRLYLPGLTL